MTSRIPESERTGYRAVNNWGDGDLPAPYALGDIIDVPDGAKALERMNGMPPGRYKIVYGPSIDDGDAWYFRLAKGLRSDGCSDRLHVAYAGRSTWDEDVNWLEDCALISTTDPLGLLLRCTLIADGWQLSRTLPQSRSWQSRALAAGALCDELGAALDTGFDFYPDVSPLVERWRASKAARSAE